MNKNQAFYNLFLSTLKRFPRLLWNGGGKIEAVRLPWYRVLRWTGEKNGVAETRLQQLWQSDQPGARDLADCFTNKDLVSYVRNTNGDAESSLYILVSFGWWFVGLKCRIVET